MSERVSERLTLNQLSYSQTYNDCPVRDWLCKLLPSWWWVESVIAYRLVNRLHKNCIISYIDAVVKTSCQYWRLVHELDLIICLLLTSELRPRVIIMMKNKIAQSGAIGIVLRASGKTTNTRPGPATDTITYTGTWTESVGLQLHWILHDMPQSLEQL